MKAPPSTQLSHRLSEWLTQKQRMIESNSDCENNLGESEELRQNGGLRINHALD